MMMQTVMGNSLSPQQVSVGVPRGGPLQLKSQNSLAQRAITRLAGTPWVAANGGHVDCSMPPTKRGRFGKENLTAQIVEKKGDVVVWGPSNCRQQGARLPRIICYGDSNTVGFHSGGKSVSYGQSLASELAEMGAPCEVAVCGLCGFTTKDMLDAQASDVARTQVGPSGRGLSCMFEDGSSVKLVIIMTGTNDLGRQTSQTSIMQHISQLHGICHSRGIPTVSIAATQTSSRSMRVLRQQLADSVAKWAASATSVLDALDVEDLVPRPVGKDGASSNPAAAVHWDQDDLHLSAAGSIALGHRLAPHVAKWLQHVTGNDIKPTSTSALSSGRAPSAAKHVTGSQGSSSHTVHSIVTDATYSSGRCSLVASVQDSSLPTVRAIATGASHSSGRCSLALGGNQRRQHHINKALFQVAVHVS